MNGLCWDIMHHLGDNRMTVAELTCDVRNPRDLEEYVAVLEGILHLVSLGYVRVGMETDHPEYGVSPDLRLTKSGKERMG